jgi:predicted secreted Zn-dependent protease
MVSLALVFAACARHSARLDVGPTPPGVTVEASIQYYDVTAASLAELRRGMVQLGPRWQGRQYTAVTQSQLRWTFQTAPRGAGCELRKVRVYVQTVVTFPRWNPTAEPDSATMAWWQQLNAGLVEHELGHAQLSVRTAGDIARDLERLTSARCDALTTQANAMGQRYLLSSQRKQNEYDAATRHGATQIEQAGRLRAP